MEKCEAVESLDHLRSFLFSASVTEDPGGVESEFIFWKAGVNLWMRNRVEKIQ